MARLQEVEEALAQPGSASDQKAYRLLTQEHSQLSELKEAWVEFQLAEKQAVEHREFLQEETDPELLQMAQEEMARLEEKLPLLRQKVEALLVPPDPRDDRSILVEIRAGTGGEEAALFVADCARMYRNYADHKGWQA